MQQINLKSQFGVAVRKKRNDLGISQEELAGRSGLHRTYISDVERGARNVSLESIGKLAQALSTSISHLFNSATKEIDPEPGVASRLVEILLVEDSPNDVELALHAFTLSKIANRVHVVRDGAEALDFVFREGPWAESPRQPLDLILLDLRLPKLSGIEVLHRLKANDATRSIPVVVLTSSEEDGDMAECRRMGVDVYIVKPLDFQSLSQATPQLQMRWGLLKDEA